MSSKQAILILTIINIAGGCSYIASDYALQGFSPLVIVFWRTILGTLFLTLACERQLKITLDLNSWFRLATIGLFGFALPLLLGTFGQKHSNAVNASLLIGVEPVFIILLSAIFLHEALNISKIASIALGITGAMLIVLQGLPFINFKITPHWKGDILLFLHGAFWALYSVIGKPLLKKMPALSFTTWTALLGCIPLSIATALSGEPLWPAHAAVQSWIAVLFLSAIVNFLVTWGWNKALGNVPASMVANFIFLQPLTGVILGTLLGRGTLNNWSILGGILILSGTYLAAHQENQRSQ